MKSCPSCERDFDSIRGMRVHHTKVHNEKLGVRKGECGACGDEFKWTNMTRERKYCSRKCASPNSSKEWRKSLSEAVTEEEKKRISERNSGDGNAMFGVTGDDHPCSEISPPNWIEVEKTGRMVRSSWEEEVDIMLYESEFSYEYEPRRFVLDDYNYHPDFVIEDKYVLEVKGYASDDCVSKGEQFVEEYSEYVYVVLQGAGEKIPADIHIEWDSRSSLIPKLLYQ